MASTNTGKFRPDTLNQRRRYDNEEDGDRDNNAEARYKEVNENIRIDHLYGFSRVTDGRERVGFLINIHSTEIVDDNKRLMSGIDLYFLEQDCSRFKVSIPFPMYFYVLCRKGTEQEVSTFLLKKYNGIITRVESVVKEDLDLPNHLIGLKQRYLKLSFWNKTEFIKVRRDIAKAVRINKEREKNNTYYNEMLAEALNPSAQQTSKHQTSDHLENILDMREYDVPLHVRVSIDMEIFVGCWYAVKAYGTDQPVNIIRRKDIIEPVEPIVLAYDIETTKLPLKFPDAATDQVMMISYMIDGQGYLITNREIISQDIENFEYTPKPEFEGQFIVFNEPNEKATLKKFFDHINDIKPHIFVSYNGDFFDWPFVETRAAFHGMDMKDKIGFEKNNNGVYACRACIHMDCLCWVKRDSYLPVGSQGLKAVAKAKLRYDPVELDPEDMCRLAVEDPEVLSNYSVSDAVATYYLYAKYVHPFIFALCTIIPMEPDEVLRKGSGTLCESLLMVEAFRANIIYPNKQEAELNKLTHDGHVLLQETYVGGHVEALESGVFRADIPCRFKIDTTAIDELMEGVENTLKHGICEEENVPFEMVTNFDEAVAEIKEKLAGLKAQPLRVENPVIVHLDVGAMYPNIILTNRLQPSAMVNETICAACDFNKPNALCQRQMEWMWRGEHFSASLGEYQRIQQQLGLEKFPPQFPGGPKRNFHQLTKIDRAAFEKKRLTEFSKKAYKKVKATKLEERVQTICQKENSFYVDTVRAFRDRRYEYKGLTKVAKQQVAAATASGDAEEIKSAKSREVLYDSLQLAHKCILNSFYGYVMRRGSRWFSMEMGGIVCYTGAHIIMKAREIIERVGRPLELDTDGIWCILPASFPDSVIVETTHPKKKKLTISYPNTVLNYMVKDQFTNNVYHELVDKDNLVYEVREENSIFFEVDGPYLAMVLPAAKEEGKKLKKRYAVFNFDGSLAELKGFEVKRRGELQLIKNFQSSVFESFLKGSTLEECYASVAKDADYWLDVLYSKGANLPDTELFELISENKFMSRKLEEYGAQKSTSISTAKRLAELLGDQMVKDAGLACKFIISSKPQGAPVTERAIPLAVFQSDPAVTRHYLRKWLKDPGLSSLDLRDILDWNYYIERLGNAIQKIITIPAALQGVSNPVPRVKHPDWLHKRLLNRSDTKRQRKITEIFAAAPVRANNGDSNDESDEEGNRPAEVNDIEDIASGSGGITRAPLPVANVANKRKRGGSVEAEEDYSKSWREALGPPPPIGTSKEERLVWLEFQKKKWAYQAKQRGQGKSKRFRANNQVSRGVIRNPNLSTMDGFLRQAQQKLLSTPWQIIHVLESNEPGMFYMWVMVDKELHKLRLMVPRIFYVNSRVARPDPGPSELWRKCSRTLPRSRPVYNLYQYSVPEYLFRKHSQQLMEDLAKPEIEGIYETQVPLEFRVLLTLGCVCTVDPRAARSMREVSDTFSMDQLEFKSIGAQPYLQEAGSINRVFLYHHWSANHQRSIWGLFLTPTKKAHIYVVDSVRTTNQMPNMSSLYSSEKNFMVDSQSQLHMENYPDSIHFDVKVETSLNQVYKLIQNTLKAYKGEVTKPTILILQASMSVPDLINSMPLLRDFPFVSTHIKDPDSLYSTLEWQRSGAKVMVQHFLKSEQIVGLMTEQCRYFHTPIGNMPADPTLFGADLFFARHLQKHNFVLWCSPTEKPDFGGSENDDNRLLTYFEESSNCAVNSPGTFSSVCIELDVESLAVNTLLQSHHVNDIEGGSSYASFHSAPQPSLQEMVTGDTATVGINNCDETQLCAPAFKILKSMVGTWLRDVSLYKNVFADYQIIHFYRWLRTSNALLYDPALRRTLHTHMRKLFLQLLSEFKRLGSIVVYADFNKMILCTKKRNVQDAIGYTEFVVQAIQNKELFHGIDISFEKCWEYLIWLDLHNHAGVRGKVPKNLTEGDTMSQDDLLEDDDEDDSPPVEMNWNLVEVLPQEVTCQASFNTMVVGYIIAVYQFMCESEPGTGTPRRRNRNASQCLTQSAPLGLGALQNTAQFAKNLIAGDMSQRLFQIVQKIHKKLPEKVIYLKDHPNLDFNGLESRKINPALELIKALCKVLSLDKEIADEVEDLQKNLLRLINIGSFSDKAEWKDPCVSFVLPEMICKACNHTRDVDLCKDHHHVIEDNKYVWKCPLCGTTYDNAEIEFLLMDAVYRKNMTFVLQDLQCLKCGDIKRDNANELCSCSGHYTFTNPRSDIFKFVKVVKSIASKCNMDVLSEVIETLHLFD